MMTNKQKWRLPWTIMRHPFQGFEDFRYKNGGSLAASFAIFVFFAMLNVFKLQFVGKQFQMVNPEEVNLFGTVFTCIVVLILWSVANWSLCVLMEGKATFKTIWIMTLYSLLPYTIAEYVNVVLGMVLTREEGVFRSFVTVVGVLWSGLLIISAFITLHEFSFPKAIGSIVITVIGMLLIAVLFFLCYTLFNQLITNVMVFANEVIYRVRLIS